jgi:hypothetical protein
MAASWWDPDTFGMWFGIIGGGVGGSLIGMLGGLAGWLAPKGRGRTWIVGSLYIALALGIVSLVLGLTALALRQPYGIWYPFLLLGAIVTIVLGANLPVILKAYAAAEQRRIEAEGIRHG